MIRERRVWLVRSAPPQGDSGSVAYEDLILGSDELTKWVQRPSLCTTWSGELPSWRQLLQVERWGRVRLRLLGLDVVLLGNLGTVTENVCGCFCVGGSRDYCAGRPPEGVRSDVELGDAGVLEHLPKCAAHVVRRQRCSDSV